MANVGARRVRVAEISLQNDTLHSLPSSFSLAKNEVIIIIIKEEETKGNNRRKENRADRRKMARMSSWMYSQLQLASRKRLTEEYCLSPPS
jgi:hypothetical protein